MKIRTSETQQQQAVIHVAETFKQYKELLQPYYERLLDVYKELDCSFKDVIENSIQIIKKHRKA